MTDPKLTPREPSEAERLAQALTDWKSREVRDLDRLDAAAELRRLAALSESNAIDALNYESRIERLQAENDALRAMHDAAPTVEADATPELLKAVRSVIAWYEAEDDHSKADFYKRLEMCRESETLCRAAIAKAEGHPAAQQPAALPEARYTEDEIADACMLAEIPDSKFESLLLVLKGKQ